MLNTTILHLLMSHSLGSPLLAPFGSIHISKSSFSFFYSHLIYSNYHSLIMHSSFSNFLSTAIKINKIDRNINREVINSRIEVKDDNLHIYFCLFQNCISISGGGGAVFISGGSIEVNFTGFQKCYTFLDRSYGGAIFTDSDSVVFNGVCSDNCYATEYGQSFYLLNRNSSLEFITITRCGIDSGSSFSSEAISVSGTVYIQNLNSTNNLAKRQAAGIMCSKTRKGSIFRIIYSSFVGNTGNSIFDISSEPGDTISFSNFVSNTAAKAIISSFGANTKPIFDQCIFQLNTFLLFVEAQTTSNVVSLVNCYSDNLNWGNATLSNCAITITSTHNIHFYSEGICNGNYQMPTASTLPTSNIISNPSSEISQTSSSSSSSIISTDTSLNSSFLPATSILTSLYPLPTGTALITYDACPECPVKKKDVGKIVAIVFCVLEALLIIILIVCIALLIIYQDKIFKNQILRKEEGQKENEDQFVIEEEEEVNDIDSGDNEMNKNTPEKGKTAFVPTPHIPSADQSPSDARKLYHEKSVTPQVPRKKKRRPLPVNERSPLIEERKKLRIVFSSSTESDDI